MKRLVDDTDVQGLEDFLEKEVLLMCANYFYAGKLTGVNAAFVELTNPKIVYETGSFSAKEYGTAEKLHTDKWRVQTSAIESYGLSK